MKMGWYWLLLKRGVILKAQTLRSLTSSSILSPWQARLPVSYSDQYFSEALQGSWSRAAVHEGWALKTNLQAQPKCPALTFSGGEQVFQHDKHAIRSGTEEKTTHDLNYWLFYRKVSECWRSTNNIKNYQEPPMFERRWRTSVLQSFLRLPWQGAEKVSHTHV